MKKENGSGQAEIHNSYGIYADTGSGYGLADGFSFIAGDGLGSGFGSGGGLESGEGYGPGCLYIGSGGGLESGEGYGKGGDLQNGK